ncbi:MAG: VRR-NUC domain-containing protein [Hyphomicrobiaceae bacterium]|nr:MAG: VRR-NUC domain-containing protein [Hyphomicrobiaceae bacterium]
MTGSAAVLAKSAQTSADGGLRNLLRSRMSESEIHHAVVAHLAHRCAANVFWTHIPAGELRPRGVGGKIKGMGLKPGVPDILLVIGGRAHFLELKKTDGRLSDSQKAAISDLQRAGAAVAVAFGLDAAIAQLEAWGALR